MNFLSGIIERVIPQESPERWAYSITEDMYHPVVVKLLHGDSTDFKNSIKEIVPYVYEFPLFSEKYCDWLIEYANEKKKWKIYAKDRRYGRTQVTLKRLNPWIYNYHKQTVWKVVSIMTYGLFQFVPKTLVSSFLIKYSMGMPDKYKGMGLHHDTDSLLSMTINLNDGYNGGGLSFVRYPDQVVLGQKGWGVLFAGNPIMAHQAHPITSGERYVCVYWIS